MNGAPRTVAERERGAITLSTRGAALFAALCAGGMLLAACELAPDPQPRVAPTATSPAAQTMSPAAQSSPSPDEYTPPPLNPRETKVISALATLGITGMRAELPFENAQIWAHGPGWQLFVGAYRMGTMRGEFTVIDERRLEGVRVQIVEYSGQPPRHHFECATDTDTYEVRGDVPPGFAEMDALVGRFIRALGCAA
jgi:hypothetical protein